MAWVKFVREDVEIEVEDGISVLEAEIQAGLRPDAPCGGLGKCGKCLVKINGEVVKACQIRIGEGETCVVETLDRAGNEKILTDGFNREVVFEPGLRMAQVELEKAKTGEKRSDWQMEVDLKLAGELYGMRRDSDEWYVIYSRRRILEMRKEAGRRCLAAFDIGTTTIAGYLLDGADGRTLAVESRMNPQAQLPLSPSRKNTTGILSYSMIPQIWAGAPGTCCICGCITTCLIKFFSTYTVRLPSLTVTSSIILSPSQHRLRYKKFRDHYKRQFSFFLFCIQYSHAIHILVPAASHCLRNGIYPFFLHLYKTCHFLCPYTNLPASAVCNNKISLT